MGIAKWPCKGDWPPGICESNRSEWRIFANPCESQNASENVRYASESRFVNAHIRNPWICKFHRNPRICVPRFLNSLRFAKTANTWIKELVLLRILVFKCLIYFSNPHSYDRYKNRSTNPIVNHIIYEFKCHLRFSWF